MGFVEVLKERELQLEAKKQREKIQLTAETDYQAQMRAEIDAATKFEAERVLQRKSNNKKNQKDLESQIRYRKDQKLAEKEADVIEGETLAQLASVEKAEKNRKKEIEIEQRKEMKFLLDKQLEMNREFQQEVTKTDKIEEDKRKIYTNAKDKMSSMRQVHLKKPFCLIKIIIKSNLYLNFRLKLPRFSKLSKKDVVNWQRNWPKSIKRLKTISKSVWRRPEKKKMKSRKRSMLKNAKKEQKPLLKSRNIYSYNCK